MGGPSNKATLSGEVTKLLARGLLEVRPVMWGCWHHITGAQQAGTGDWASGAVKDPLLCVVLS